MQVPWENRSNKQRLSWMIYKIFRVIQVTVWFYFYPFLVIFVSYGLPFIFNQQDKAL